MMSSSGVFDKNFATTTSFHIILSREIATFMCSLCDDASAFKRTFLVVARPARKTSAQPPAKVKFLMGLQLQDSDDTS